MPFWSKESWNASGKHCYVTGGSSGLGLALATTLAARGAHVSIVARGQQRLDDAMKQIEAKRQSPDQIFRSFSADLRGAAGANAALDAITEVHDGRTPDAIFLCAGVATPRFFVESTEQDLASGMDLGYWTEAWTAWAVTKRMVEQGRKGKIVFVASTLGYMSFVGWSSYSPARHAVRGLADTLRSELLLYDIDVHLFCPNTMHTPGYVEENRTKPQITSLIEEGDSPVSPEQAATALLKGVADGHTHISGDMVTELFRAATRGSAPYHNFVYDCILDTAAFIATPIWRSMTDSRVRAHKPEHARYLRERGLQK
ncbi:oxidoreductase [Gloeophyllum trabeum ATCC 11539]|uniref:3-dehydrosphinganine reductase n=1 Tax=Gloeophyllum trabeum (strain ATCC 11539 / FP-39264 / Madison 617) TaxID=670483 RepID=S7Q7T0_GLOTA|nr:oxidoreductase [Gloeophyllum trabeum ATCC 11539]EPQ55592.1 oxidoreductase [Gloeophyllum trabeum ATCC 11539]